MEKTARITFLKTLADNALDITINDAHFLKFELWENFGVTQAGEDPVVRRPISPMAH